LLQVVTSGSGLYGERLAVTLGFITLGLALATFASCRSCLVFLGRFGMKAPLETRGYRVFYRFHGYYWSLFVFALVLHFMTVLMHTGFPAAGDPNGPAHWLILSLGLGSLALAGTVLASCRSLVGLVKLFAEKGPLSSSAYRVFHRYHSYYWIALVLLIAGHFVSAYSHTGFWP